MFQSERNMHLELRFWVKGRDTCTGTLQRCGENHAVVGAFRKGALYLVKGPKAWLLHSQVSTQDKGKLMPTKDLDTNSESNLEKVPTGTNPNVQLWKKEQI